MTEIEKETGMTDAKCEYWDDYFTKNPPKVDPGKNSGFAKKSLSIATHTPPAELVGETVTVRERIAASV